MEMPELRAQVLAMRDATDEEDSGVRDAFNDVLLLIDDREPGAGWVHA